MAHDIKKHVVGWYTVDGQIHCRPSTVFAVQHFQDRKDLICAEIGVQRGDHANLLLNVLKPKLLYLIDPWIPMLIDGKVDSYGDHDDNYKVTCERHDQNDHVVIIKEESQTALPVFESDSFDFIYLDGNHEKNACVLDIYNSIRLVKIGGIVAGHDYGLPSGIKELRPGMDGVVYAVHSVFEGEFVNAEWGDWWVVVDNSIKELVGGLMQPKSWREFFMERVGSVPFVPVASIGEKEVTWEAHTSLEKYIEFYSKNGAGYFWVIMSMMYNPKVVVEFGTACGFTTNVICKMNPQAIVHSIDNSKIAATESRPTGIIVESNENVNLIIGNSQEFQCENVELCFIDANHSKDSVLADSYRAWTNRNDGDWCIVWDDYALSSVKEAVDYFTNEMKDYIPFVEAIGAFLVIGTKSMKDFVGMRLK